MNKKYMNNIISNKQVLYKYFVEKTFEAGICLKGWEVKSLRQKKINISNSYVILKNGSAYLFGVKFQPIITTFKHNCNEENQQLLLKKKELNTLYGFNKKKGYTIVLISLFWKKVWAKAKIGIAKGKKSYDHREEIKQKEWNLKKSRILKNKQ